MNKVKNKGSYLPSVLTSVIASRRCLRPLKAALLDALLQPGKSAGARISKLLPLGSLPDNATLGDKTRDKSTS